MSTLGERKLDSRQTPDMALRSVVRLSPIRAWLLHGVFGVVLGAFSFLEIVRSNTTLQWAFFGTSTAMLICGGVVFVFSQGRGRVLRLNANVRKQHFVQAIAQMVFFVYWGWYWRPAYDAVFLIAAQVVFAYGFEMLLCWSRRDLYTIGFGPVPIVLSINLFLWFRDDWFFLQFLLVALGFMAKELIRWNRNGQHVHIFNPSSFPLAIFSLGLIFFGASDLTWGQDIATTQFFPPHVYLVVFLVALPGQYLFGVASMTVSAVVVTYLFGLLYFAVTGVYFFYDSYIPVSVFLGMHLLFTDPSTAPRSEIGRLGFGALYGLSTVLLYGVLSLVGVPPFYDKLLQVPVLNLMSRAMDRISLPEWFRSLSAKSSGDLIHAGSSRQRKLAYMMLWILIFGSLSAVG